jgi:WhiB family redox-sensing transcriptional regulator
LSPRLFVKEFEETPAWYAYAACRAPDVDRAWFFAHRGEMHKINAAKKTCWRCPARLECLAYAMTNREVYGIWGGTSERERREIRKQRKNARMEIVP